MKTKLDTTTANFLVAFNFGRIDALEGVPNTRFSGKPNGTEEENTVWPQIREAYLDGFRHQSVVLIAPAQLNRGDLVQTTLPLTDTEKAALYLDWFNNYNTLQHFAHCKGFTRQEASTLIAEGRRIHEASLKPRCCEDCGGADHIEGSEKCKVSYPDRTFTCITVSSNTNSFGYRAALFLAPDGTGFECLYSFGAELPVRGQDVVEDKLPTYCRRTLAPTLPKKAVAVIKSAKA